MYFTMKCFLFFFNDTATTEIYTLSLHDALPISMPKKGHSRGAARRRMGRAARAGHEGLVPPRPQRSEEHTSELQSRSDLVCRLLLEKKTNSLDPHADATSSLTSSPNSPNRATYR